ncbi:HlyD family type I secretion periplasmic adaptor subunit [Pseudomonas sp. QE6]|uniref:HlyD family type I secretion periplasmic adaptor subunit n=1 Tax=Pseudomonas sp. QE6 TaxID=3242491 RepID=UPI00352807BD
MNTADRWSGKAPRALETDPNREVRFGLSLLAIGLGGFLLWAGFAPLDQGVVGNGTVVVAGERKTVQTLQGGVIERILVREGDQVRRGQPLLQFNEVQAQAQLAVALGQWFTARSVEARLIAERVGHPEIVWPEELQARRGDPRAQAAMALQQDLFATRRAEQLSQLQILKHEQAALQEQLGGYQRIATSQDNQLRFQEQELVGLRSLARDGYVPRNRLLEAERNAAELTATAARNIADIGRTRQAIRENALKSLQQEQSFRREAESQLTEVAAEAAGLTERIKALEFELANSRVTAPVDGQVIGLVVHTVGGVVPAGQRLMDIVPQGGDWVLKAQFPPLVADRLSQGLPVDIRFASLQRVQVPVLLGRVTTVSADQLLDERSRLPYFSVEVAPAPGMNATLQEVGLVVKPGMQADVIIKTGERTLFSYLLRPLTARLSSAFKEE